nr:hypothetical protein CFP56_12905 [Quercus suber]
MWPSRVTWKKPIMEPEAEDCPAGQGTGSDERPAGAEKKDGGRDMPRPSPVSYDEFPKSQGMVFVNRRDEIMDAQEGLPSVGIESSNMPVLSRLA